MKKQYLKTVLTICLMLLLCALFVSCGNIDLSQNDKQNSQETISGNDDKQEETNTGKEQETDVEENGEGEDGEEGKTETPKDDEKDDAPEYIGMTVTDSIVNHAPANAPQDEKTSDLLETNHNDFFGFQTDVESVVRSKYDEEADPALYYAEKNSVIYVIAHFRNDKQYGISSFKINNKRYTSYMFESGSNTKNVIVRVEIGEETGLEKYEISDIKYTDNNNIKDVKISGKTDFTVGVHDEGEIFAEISVQEKKADEVTVKVTIDEIFAEEDICSVSIYNGEKILEEKPVSGAESTISFTGLTPNMPYQLAVVGSIKDLNNEGKVQVIKSETFFTDAVLLFRDPEVSYHEVTFGYYEDERYEVVKKEVEIFKGNQSVKKVNLNALQITELLSDTEYELRTKYTYHRKEYTISLYFKTETKQTPVVELTAGASTNNKIDFVINEEDQDQVGTLTKIELYKNGQFISKAESTSVRSFDQLSFNSEYEVKIEYAYDLGDGKGEKFIRKSIVCKTANELLAKDMEKLEALTDYGSKQMYYEKAAVTYSGTMYAGRDCSTELSKLQFRINEKKDDVEAWDATTSAVKIFVLSTPEGLMESMARAALTFEEMQRVVEYFYGTVADADLSRYLKKGGNGEWNGIFTGKTTLWRSVLNDDGKAFNTGWSIFDDWELFDRLKEYAGSAELKTTQNSTAKDNAEDNAAWQLRSILKKIYEEVKLDGDTAARLVTYILDYAVTLVEAKSGGNVNDALDGSNKKFAEYCKKVVKKENNDKPMDGLGDYETLSYLLSFNQYYHADDGLKNCVSLFGYIYDYAKGFVSVCLEEDTFAKQLRYQRLSTYTNDEWLEYVAIQRNIYEKAYRYEEDFYRAFYTQYLAFQGIVERFDIRVFEMDNVANARQMTKLATMYTLEMSHAIEKKTNSINGLDGQLALCDWLWCYSGNNDAMIAFNQANTKYQNGKNSNYSEAEYEGMFYYGMQTLRLIDYLLTKMSERELSSTLYCLVYAYSASMVKNMQEDIKKIVYIDKGVEKGSEYTSIASDVAASESNNYAMGKITVLYGQAYDSWTSVNVTEKAKGASNQSWGEMRTEVRFAIDYDYENNISFKNNRGHWRQKYERMEDLVVMKKWSCCDQKVHETDPTKCGPNHGVYNKDGTSATKDYDENHKISLFVKNYEKVILHITGQAKLSFQKPEKGFQTVEDKARTWTAGYRTDDNSFYALYTVTKTFGRRMTWKEDKTITIKTGKSFAEEIDGEDKDWWYGKPGASGAREGNDKVTKFPTDAAADVKQEDYGGRKVNYAYSYTFKNWYLDKECRYEFDEDDEVNFDLVVYAGYEVKKTRQ